MHNVAGSIFSRIPWQFQATCTAPGVAVRSMTSGLSHSTPVVYVEKVCQQAEQRLCLGIRSSYVQCWCVVVHRRLCSAIRNPLITLFPDGSSPDSSYKQTSTYRCCPNECDGNGRRKTTFLREKQRRRNCVLPEWNCYDRVSY